MSTNNDTTTNNNNTEAAAGEDTSSEMMIALDLGDEEETGKPKISVVRKHRDYCILRISRGIGPRAVLAWLHKLLESELFQDATTDDTTKTDDNLKKRKRHDDPPEQQQQQPSSLLATSAVLAHPHYSAYARSLVLVARNKEALQNIKELFVTVHCLVKGLRKPPGEAVYENSFNNNKCCIKARPLAVARSNTAGHITLLAATNVNMPQTTSQKGSTTIIQPRQFRRQLKAAEFPVLGSAKDCTPFRGESLCMSVVRLQFQARTTPLKNNQSNGHHHHQYPYYHRSKDPIVEDAVSIPPAPRLRAILDREERFWKAKHPQAPRPISVSLDNDLRSEDPIPIPQAYVTETAVFCGLEFRVTPAVMIPRIGSEAVVERAIALYEATLPLRSYTETPLVLDLGIGSGCLLLSILHRLLNSFGVGIELSPTALEVAEYNASALGLKTRCNLYEGPFNEPTDISDEPFDIVVCNPPYHTRGGRKPLDASSVAHEPDMALFIEHDNNKKNLLKHYREVMCGLEQADMVKPGTVLVFEVFKDNANGVADLMHELKLEQVAIGKDSNGCIRTVEGIYPPASPLLLEDDDDDSSMSDDDDDDDDEVSFCSVP